MRYIVVDQAEHPCCHVAMVIDTQAEPDFSYGGKRICECWYREDAEVIAALMNKEND